MNKTRPQTIDEMAAEIGLSDVQTKAVKEYVLSLIVDNFKQMKEEYNQELDTAIKNLTS